MLICLLARRRSGEWIDLQYRMRALGNDIVSIGTVEDLTQ